MKKNKLALVLSAVSIIGLAACNNQDRNEMDNNNNGEISNISTNLSSQNYPHTRAILTQDAKYRSMAVEPYGNRTGYRFPQASEIPRYDQIQPGQALVPQQVPAEQRTPVPQQAPTEQVVPAPQQAPTNQAPAPQQAPTNQAPTQQPRSTQQAPTNISQAVQQVIDLTNAERSRNGLPGLTMDNQLCGVAQKKSVDMQQNNYFSHTSPTYGSPFDMMRDLGVTYNSAGENIAQGQQTPQEVVQAWMNSEGHRKNILDNSFTHIGVGYEQNGNHWTQMFIGK
ncbi:CAP domain-containing protein [Peribacillus alkalitolerans]|uniref:CAP domain-containing protein n=1 Tax=Peribacillus alkalitolerans TaxID=1550385 RepID=UPI001F072F3E|nr:CAP domain-containing protein [Peribacillus alkalitolerans]